MLKFCNTYAETANKVRDVGDAITKDLEKAEKDYQEALNESALMSIAEGIPVAETLFASMPWIRNGEEFVMEGNEGSSETGRGVLAKPKGPEPVGVDGVGGSNPNGEVQRLDPKTGEAEKKPSEMTEAEKKEAEEKKKAKVKGKGRIKLYYQTQVKVYTAMMTITEEKYYAYLRTLRQIHTAIKGMSSESSKPEEKK